MLHGRNVSRVVGQRYSVCEEGRNERPLTDKGGNESSRLSGKQQWIRAASGIVVAMGLTLFSTFL